MNSESGMLSGGFGRGDNHFGGVKTIARKLELKAKQKRRTPNRRWKLGVTDNRMKEVKGRAMIYNEKRRRWTERGPFPNTGN
ncbi:hypothetical protein I7I50_00566 [Histoplasma capsulatum G186AR]|uniref:Uncharacterized protein n=1 Tax=Ajellomyces capsulatus TaxID=5037 RepID=A0A8H7YFV7_AJECA|nr:hypothetical protein I7I52_07834 [Histoplasma capsulatum]QSS72650.1 hypothetical protein I7I50_00566 [Histoplasma capsulatum G186AR]